jgi:hypothetical protein
MSLDVSLRVAIFWIAAVLCIIAELAILRSMMRGSRASAPVAPDGETNAAVPRGRPAMELIWAVVPAIGLIFVLLATRGAIR